METQPPAKAAAVLLLPCACKWLVLSATNTTLVVVAIDLREESVPSAALRKGRNKNSVCYKCPIVHTF